MTGQFRIPPRTVNLTGNVGFTRPRTPDEEVVAANAFIPHMHYTTTFRCRTIRRGGSDVFELNYYTNASTIGVQNWYDATDDGNTGRQPACRHYAQSEVWNTGSYIPSGTFLGFGATFEYYGICKGSCGGFITSCLIPTGNSITVDTTPEGPCRQTYVTPLFSVGPVNMTCAGSSKNLGANYVEGADGVGNDNIPTAASTPGGVVQSFGLYENYVAFTGNPADYYSKGLGQWAYSNFGSSLWSSLSDFAQGDVDMVGGSGTGLRVTVRFEAWPGGGGNPNNTRYKVVALVNPGSGYAAGDELEFPDIGAYSISSGSAAFGMRVNTTSFGGNAEDGAAYPHNTSLHDVLPVDTQVDSNINAAYPQLSNIIETTTAFDYESDPTQHTHTLNYTTGLTNYKLNIPETFVSTDGMNASININPESDTKIDNLIAPFIMVDYLIKT
tara:strand:+ start:1 stop:1323 length:1323 start_codon:yes stop_codon:yes gene_type:complete